MRGEPTGQIDDSVDADAIISEMESPTPERSMNGGDAPAPEAAPAPKPDIQPAPAALPAAAELEFDYNGKPIKVPFSDPRAKTWAQQGYDYSQKMAAFNAERAQFEQTASTYKTVDDYARQHPEWWAHVQSAWKTREESREQGRSDASLSPEVRQKLQEFDELKKEVLPVISELKQDREKQRVEKEDTELSDQMKSIREKYSNLDWASVDERGQSKLERQVLEHAVKEGIKSYRVAFHDYHHEHLTKLHEERGKEQVTKDLQKRAKLGIIGESPTPTKAMRPAESVKNKSYNDIEREIREEYGIA